MSRLAALLAEVRGERYRPPPTRGDCEEGRANTGSLADRLAGRARCEALRCRHNLDRVDSQDVPGRRHGGLAPPWTLSGENTNAGSPSCALDVAGLGEHSCAQVAEYMGINKRTVELIVAAARRTTGAAQIARLGMEDG